MADLAFINQYLNFYLNCTEMLEASQEMINFLGGPKGSIKHSLYLTVKLLISPCDKHPRSSQVLLKQNGGSAACLSPHLFTLNPLGG